MYQKGNKELKVLMLYRGGYYKQFYLREISKLAKIPVKTTQGALATLEKKCVLKSSLRGKNKYFRLNIGNIQTKLYLMQVEVFKAVLFIDKYPLFKMFLKEVKTRSAIVVFGSFAKFAADKESDLDLLIVLKEGEEQRPLPFHLLPYKVHEISLAEPSFMKSLEKQETLIKEIEENHVVLNGHSFYVDAMWDYYGK